MEYNILNWIQEHLRGDFLDSLFIFITSLGNAGVLWIFICIALLCYKKTRRYGILMGISLGLCLLFGNVLLKNIVERLRPFQINEGIELIIAMPLDYSFPSGHTMSSFAAAVILYALNRKIGIVALVVASLIGFSRLYLYVHFPSDVIIGAIMGIIISLCIIKIAKKHKYIKNTTFI